MKFANVKCVLKFSKMYVFSKKEKKNEIIILAILSLPVWSKISVMMESMKLKHVGDCETS